MTISITRSFERTRQIADFVPIKAYCQASAEIDVRSDEVKGEGIISDAEEELSRVLTSFCEREVDKTLMSYYPQCIVCGGKGQKMSLNKEGVCGQCVTQMHFQIRDLKESGTPKPKVAKQ